ncbi:MAG: GNAT family N-acetyltransferase [Rikenellaceae bacterium]|nr:GNAT family N-acetyltransferase [Rikenellaceae bacterium]
MNTSKIVIRPAQRGDAATIAMTVAMAIGDERALQNYCGDNYLAVLAAIACTKGTQYSWQNALIAEYEGQVAGAVVGYDGAQLEQLRKGTLAVIQKHVGRVPTIADETETGEYYLDSVAVMTEFRGLGLGVCLVNAFCDKAFAEGYERVGLIVDCDNPKAEMLYTSQGFERVGERWFFGHRMWHLQRVNTWDIHMRVMRSSCITPFQRRVYLELLRVPSGSTITYGELAQRIGCRSAQAVGQALKCNPFAPQVPCHRVVAADGSLGGYCGQRSGKMIERKKQLLEEEQVEKQPE